MKVDIKALVRPNIVNLKPYSSARSEFDGVASVFLDANENAFGSPLDEDYNRYPDPLQKELRQRLAELYTLDTENICVGNGSDELIDHVIRVFCNPSEDEIIVCPPTFKMYEVAAEMNDVTVKKILLNADFSLDVDLLLQSISEKTKLIFLCSPNNPTGNVVPLQDVKKLLNAFSGIVVVDEAYIDFSSQPSVIGEIKNHNNLLVLRTLSKAWGLAGLRVGVAVADKEIIDWMLRVKMPYNVNTVSQKMAIAALQNKMQVDTWNATVGNQKQRLLKEFGRYPFFRKVFPGEANFILVKVDDASRVYRFLAAEGIIVRNQSSQPLLDNCLRITIGTPEENDKLIDILNQYEQ